MSAEELNAPLLWILDDGRTMGGGQLFNLRLATHLGVAAMMVSPRGSAITRTARDRGLPVYELPFPAPSARHLPDLAAASLRLRRSVPADAVILSAAIRSTLVAQMACLPNPSVVLMHERASAARRSVKLALSRCHALVVVGSESADAYRRALPRAAVSNVNNFLDAARFRELAMARATRPLTSATRRPPVLGVLARLTPEKGVDALIAELAHHPDAWGTLLIGGPGEDHGYVDVIMGAIERAGLESRISLLGEITDVPRFLARLDALVVPSTGPEGQPTVILEALAAGLPVIVRSSMASRDFAGLPVVPYGVTSQLRERLLELPPGVEAGALAERFGVGQVMATLNDAIETARARRASHRRRAAR